MLAEALAKHFRTVWVPEYAREYIDHLHRPYVREDILEIAKGQLRNEKRLEKQAKEYLFCDTELIVTKIWSEFKYGTCEPWILEQIEKHRYDVYLLCYIDLPWESDPQREHPHLREELFNLYLQEMLQRDLPFGIVDGSGEKRLDNALKIIKSIL